MAFTDENTTGYTKKQLADLNTELAQRLAGIKDPEERDAAEKAFADEVSRR